MLGNNPHFPSTTDQVEPPPRKLCDQLNYLSVKGFAVGDRYYYKS
ncbi:hypothetical protein APA_806 [Pseudanabaena sp. lw0831]|nr:hypothetical protein [Pseudanabaena sp. lw0831]GBO53005.1 hypothetical protein APA_806 [Pseudanabaena sp. lw0831]